MGQSLPVDIFVLLHPRHFDVVVRCVESVREYLPVNCERICIVTAALPTDLRGRLDLLGCTYLHEADVWGADASQIPGQSKVFVELVKWELRRFCNTQTYLVLNATSIFSRPTELWQDDRPVLFCQNQFRFSQLMCFNYFFGQIPYPTSPASGDIAHFDPTVIQEMVDKIQARWKAPWIQAALAIVQQVPGTAFHAADTFGHYLHLFFEGRFTVRAEQQKEKPIEKDGVVRMATLGHNGRFANQIFQYAYLRTYADQNHLRHECPPWIGCSLFGHASTLSDNPLPIYGEDKGDVEEMIRFDSQQEYRNLELWGYFQNPAHWARDRQKFRSLFEPLPFLKAPLDAAIARLKSQGGTLVAIHLRRGDFNGGPVFWPAPEAWYLRWLDQIWMTLQSPILYVATDDPVNVLPHFAAYQPKTAADLQVTVNGAEFYSDFYVLSQSDVLGISNSTFSFAAAMLNQNAIIFARPDPDRETDG